MLDKESKFVVDPEGNTEEKEMTELEKKVLADRRRVSNIEEKKKSGKKLTKGERTDLELKRSGKLGNWQDKLLELEEKED